MRRWKPPFGRNVTAWAVVAALLPAVALSGGPAPAAAAALHRGAAASMSGWGETCGSLSQGSHAPGPVSASANPVVTLVTGDRVRLVTLPDGSVSANPVLPGGASARPGSPGLVQFTSNGDAYAVPYSAIAYLGSLLDPRLFDISYLVRAGLDDAHSAGLPVTVSYRGGPGVGRSSPLALPGLRAATGDGGIAAAVLAKAQAPALGSLLAAGWHTLHAGRPLAAGDPLRGVLRIDLAPGSSSSPLPGLPQSTVPAMTRPNGTAPRYVTLTLNIIGLDGKPGAAAGWVQNLNDSKYGAFDQAGFTTSAGTPDGEPGPIRISVPEGTYSVQFAIVTPHAGTYKGVDSALVAEPQIAVHSDTAITLDARTAKPYHVSLDPAVSSQYRVDEISYTRNAAGEGCASDLGWLGLVSKTAEHYGASDLRAAATAPVTLGSVGFEALTVLYPNDLSVPSNGPRYYLVFPSSGRIPGTLSYQVPRSALATVRQRISAPAVSGITGSPQGTAPAVFLRWGGAANQGWLFFEPDRAGVPVGTHTDYWYSSKPALVRWQANAITASAAFLHSSEYLQIRPGQQISENWQAGPLVPSPVAAPVPLGMGGGSPAYLPFQIPQPAVPAARQGQVALLNLQQGDNSGSHYAEDPSNSAGTFSFWRNGVLAEELPPLSAFKRDENYYLDGALLPLLASPATYRLDWKLAPWTNARVPDPVVLTDTDWTFRSGPAGPPVVPSSGECGPDPSRPCTFLPLLFLRYDLPLNDLSQAKAGAPITFTITAQHQQGEAPPAGVTVTVSASFNDGRTWATAVPATPLGGSRFKVTIDQPPLPATPGFASLRITARDNAGNSVVQTLIRAYGLTK